MHIKFDLDIPRWLSRLLIVGTTAAFVAIAAWVYAAVPNTFKSGDSLSAQKINDNFAALQTGVNAAAPPGSIMAYGGPLDSNPGTLPDGGSAGTHLPPTGWLFCNGDAVGRAQYPALFTAVGIAHGMGDGINTFNLPDYRGRFLRGVDGTAGRDLDAASRSTASPGGNSGDMVGSVQGDQLTSHGHSVSLGYNSVAGNQYPFIAAIWSGELSHVVEPPSDNYVGFAGGSETRPKNVNVNYIIKY